MSFDRPSPPFKLWLRRAALDADGNALRFRVEKGKGVLRVTRPGVLIVPPARDRGFEDHLSAQQLRSTQFLHIAGPGRDRSTWSLARISDEVLELLDPEVWHELDPVEDGGERFLLIDGETDVIALGAESLAEILPHEIFGADPFGDVASIVDRVRTLRDPAEDDEVIEMDPESVASAHAFLGRLRPRAAPPSTEIPPPDPSEDEADPQSEPDGRLPFAPPAHAEQGGAALAEETEPISAVKLPSPPRPPMPLGPVQEEQRVPRDLVKHLRREIDRRQLQIVELQARVEELEARLGQRGPSSSGD